MKNNNATDTIKNFCIIQLQILKEQQTKLRKQILDCKMQEEFLRSTLNNLDGENVSEE